MGKINSYYYIFANTEYAVSSDFINWKTHTIGISAIMPNSTIYGYKIIENIGKAIACVKIGDGATSITGSTYFFKPYICDYTQSATGELSFINAAALNPPGYVNNESSFIDPDVLFYDGKYNIVFKDEINQTAILYKASDLTTVTTWTKYTFSNNIWGYEAPKLCVAEGKLSLVVSFYNFEAYVKNHVTFTSGSNSWSNIVNIPAVFYDVYSNPSTEYISFGKGVYKNRHLGIMKCDFNILSKYIFTSTKNYEYPFMFVCGEKTTCTYKGIIIPNFCFTVTGSTPNITIEATSISDFRNYRNPETNAMYLSSNAGYNPSITLKGDYFAVNCRDSNIAKMPSETPTGYNVFTGRTVKLAINCNTVNQNNYTLY